MEPKKDREDHKVNIFLTEPTSPIIHANKYPPVKKPILPKKDLDIVDVP